jgi:ATP sulfurylase
VDEGAMSKKRTATEATSAEVNGNEKEPSSKKAKVTEDGVEEKDAEEGDKKPAEAPKKQAEDLTQLMSGWFDTVNAGLKTEARSYSKIVETLKVSSGDFWSFLKGG